MTKKNWIADAVPPENKGLLRKKMGVKKGETIPKGELDKKIKALQKKGEGDKKLTPMQRKTLRQMMFAKTVGKFRR